MGVILYSLVCGMLPFDDDNPIFLFRQVKYVCKTRPSEK
jgi:hypothetical protein